MSQYPSPYYPPSIQPPFAPHAGFDYLLTPARRAGVLMMVIGGLLLLLSVCNILQFLTNPVDDQLKRYQELQSMQSGPTMEMSNQLFKILMITVPVLMGIAGIIIISLRSASAGETARAPSRPRCLQRSPSPGWD